jgi:hypothetical protein
MRVFNVMLLALLVSVSAEAGSVLKVDSKDASGKTAPREMWYAQDGMLRIDDVDARGNVTESTVVRDNVIWKIDPAERTYTRVDQESLKSMMGGKSAQMEAMIANLPPEKRAMIEARMAKMQQHAANTQFTFTDTGKSDHAGQYACRLWQEQRNGKPFADYCVVPTSSLPAGAELDAAMKKAVATTSQIVASVPQLAKQAEHITRLGSMNGFPASSRIHEEEERVLTSAQSQALPADKFAIPKGFTEKPFGQHESE